MEDQTQRHYDLLERMINFAVQILKLAESLPNTSTGKHIHGQLLRCGSSPSANYAEAQSAESRADFIHKIKIVTKELRETRVWLVLIARIPLVEEESNLNELIHENDELISIFVRSATTAKINLEKSRT